MYREFICSACGLFHWHEQYVTDETGRIDYNPHVNCPNPACESHIEDFGSLVAVDTFGYAYFCESVTGKNTLKKAWTSKEYCHESIDLESYRKQGVRIEE